MKILIDKIVKNENDCPFSIYHGYPLVTNGSGYYTCNFDKTECKLDLTKKECNCFKELKNE